MPLVNMKELLSAAVKSNYGIGSFSVGNMEMVMGAVQAAEEQNAPIILQIAQVRLPYSPLELIGPLMIRAAENAKVPVAVHFDHGTTVEKIHQALELGFTSVMFDGSHLGLEDNVRETLAVKELAAGYGAALEGEVGRVGGSEDGKASQVVCSNPEEARRYYDETGVDALAIAIGNAHGSYHGEPQLQFGVLEEIAALLPGVPLVLHGGSGISDNDFRKCIAQGIKKVNIATASFEASTKEVQARAAGAKANYFAISDGIVQGTRNSVARHIQVFGTDGKA